MINLKPWLARPTPETFPLDAVIAAFRKTGKHFVEDELLTDLATARAGLPVNAQALRRFFDTALENTIDVSTIRVTSPCMIFHSRPRRAGARSTHLMPSGNATG